MKTKARRRFMPKGDKYYAGKASVGNDGKFLVISPNLEQKRGES